MFQGSTSSCFLMGIAGVCSHHSSQGEGLMFLHDLANSVVPALWEDAPALWTQAGRIALCTPRGCLISGSEEGGPSCKHYNNRVFRNAICCVTCRCKGRGSVLARCAMTSLSPGFVQHSQTARPNALIKPCRPRVLNPKP